MRNLQRTIFWAFYFTIAFRVCFRTPLNPIVFNIEAVFIAVLMIFLGIRIARAFSGKIKFSKFELYLCFFLIFPFWSAVASYIEWGQPFFYGIGTQRSFFLFVSAFYLIYKLKRGDVSLKVIKDSFLVIAWGAFFGFLVTGWVINPANYIETDFVGYNELKGGYIFKFVVTFLTMGFLYYAIKAFQTKNIKWLIPSLILFSYIVFVRQDRSIILTALGTLGLYYLQNQLRRNFAKTIVGGLIVVTLGLSFLLSTGTDFLSNYFVKYENIIKTLEGSSTSESSTNARRIEALKVFPYISKNPIIGSGELSLHYKNGFARVFGYLYPTDIGIIGEIFLYGFLGVILLNSQFIVGWYYARKVKTYNHDVFFLTCKYTLATFFMDSLTSGQTVYYSANCIIIITILYFYSRLEGERQISTS